MYDNASKYILFNYITNSICYLLLLSFFIWEKIYYTSIHKTDDPSAYFIASKKNSDEKDKNINTVINYINFYNFCSQIIVLSDGNIKIIRKQSKNSLNFVI